MRVLVVGSGGREHALAWALARDSEVEQIYAAPGNPGIAETAKCVEISATSIGQLASFAKKESIDLTIVGPEAPLSLGIVDAFQHQGLRIFGPDRQAARIESSKSFAKDLCSKFRIPTPRWETFTNHASARSALDRFGPPWVVKADGLASGKGTTVTQDPREAESAVQKELRRDAGRVVLEEFIDGWEATFMATISAGRVQWLTPIFQDYKPISDGDVGPNTGGMGCYSPISEASPSLVEKVERNILSPAVKAMEELGIHYQGLLNLNAIVSKRTGEPYMLEFNARFGDPEAQGVAMLVESGLAAHLNAVAGGSDKPAVPKTSGSACVVVVLASKGYPTSQSLGDMINIHLPTEKIVTIFHAGTARTSTGELVTAGGRVLNVAATGATVESTRRRVYSIIGTDVQFSGMQYRKDIGIERTHQRNLQAPRST